MIIGETAAADKRRGQVARPRHTVCARLFESTTFCESGVSSRGFTQESLIRRRQSIGIAPPLIADLCDSFYCTSLCETALRVEDELGGSQGGKMSSSLTVHFSSY